MISLAIIFAVLTTLSDINRSLRDDFRDGTPFVVTGTVVSALHLMNAERHHESDYCVTDGTDFAAFRCTNDLPFAAVGDRVVIRGA